MYNRRLFDFWKIDFLGRIHVFLISKSRIILQINDVLFLGSRIFQHSDIPDSNVVRRYLGHVQLLEILFLRAEPGVEATVPR